MGIRFTAAVLLYLGAVWVFYQICHDYFETPPAANEYWMDEDDFDNPFNKDTLKILQTQDGWVLYRYKDGQNTYSKEISDFKNYKDKIETE